MKKTNASAKSNELNLVLSSHFKGKINLARIKLVSHFIIAFCKVALSQAKYGAKNAELILLQLAGVLLEE